MTKFHVMLALGLALSPVLAAHPQQQQTVVAPQGVKDAFNTALEEVRNAQSEDLFSVAVAVLQSGGTETEFYRLMKQAAESSDPVALRWLAQYSLLSVQGDTADLTTNPKAVKAREFMKAAADAGYVPAQVDMARYAGSGVGAPAGEAEGMQYLMKASRAGSPRARAAYLLLTGRLSAGKFDAPEVASELKKNNFHLEEVIASLYGDSPEALEWLEKASEHGSATAAFLLGQSKAQTDEAASMNLLKLAAERHLPEALATLGVMQLNGTEQQEGLRNLQLSFMLGYTPAATTLAAQFINSPRTYTAERVFDLYNLGAVLQDARASVAYAYCLVTGRGCAPMPEQGVTMLRELSYAGSPYANVALADLYFNGCGVEPDMMKAINYLGEADAAGVPNAYVLMAVLTRLGNAAAKPDARRSELYLKMAEERGEIGVRSVYDALVAEKSWHFLPPAQNKP